MAVTFSKLLALTVAAGYTTATCIYAPSLGMAMVTFLVALGPVALIWFPEFLGGAGIQRKKTILGTYDEPGRPMNRPMRDSHPAVVAFMGWFLLVGLPPLVYWITR